MAAPEAIFPNQGARGERLTVTFSGDGFNLGIISCDFGKGISVGKPSAVRVVPGPPDREEFDVDIEIRPDAPIGIRRYDVTVTDSGGTSDPKIYPLPFRVKP